MLVSALASVTNAQIYFNLETDSFSSDRQDKLKLPLDKPPVFPIHRHTEEISPILDHKHDVEDYHYAEEERQRHDHMHFKEVHRPGETIHYDSFGEYYHRMWPTSDF